MIQGNIRTEAEYRSLEADSSSSLKEFSMDRKKYYRKFIENQAVEEDEKESRAIILGKLTETLLFEEDTFDDKFYLSAVGSIPTGNMLDFVEALYKHTKEATNDVGEVILPFSELAQLAYKDSGFKWKLDTVLSKFKDSNAELYYQEIRNIRSKGLTVVTIDDVSNAKKTVEGLKNSTNTGPILNLVNSNRYSILVQRQIDGYDIDGLPMKSMIDLIIIDHEMKIIYIYDLKTVWSVEGFFKDYYLYRRAYIQAYVYFKAAQALKDQLDLKDYIIRYPQFIVCDSINYYRPLVYQVTADDLEDAYNGFIYENREYPGVKNIVRDIIWAKENNIWNISRENYLNNGIVPIRK